MERPRPATLAWSVLAASIITYDLLSPESETLSEGADRALQHPSGRYAALAGIAIVSSHLANILPEPVDPIHLLAKNARGHIRRAV